jgi:polyphosphate kinase
LLGLKTHSKVALVVRKEGDHIRRYVHLATGNYNHVTAYQYEDLGLFTADADIGADVSDLFNYLTGYSAKTDYRQLLQGFFWGSLLDCGGRGSRERQQFPEQDKAQ